MRVILRMLSAITTSLFISITIIWEENVLTSQQLESVNYSSFTVSLLIIFIPLTLLFLIFGVPYSIFVDQRMKAVRINRVIREIIIMLMYAIGGVISVVLFTVMLSWNFQVFDNLWLLLIGGLMALAYYIVLRVMEFIAGRSRQQKGNIKENGAM